MVFLATKHHVEYAKDFFEAAGVDSTYIYGSLDQTGGSMQRSGVFYEPRQPRLTWPAWLCPISLATARKINTAKFRAGKTKVLLVTDVAARGIDIPLLDCVINVDFPSKPKLFVHRVGRVARAGRSGTAYSLVSPEEVCGC